MLFKSVIISGCFFVSISDLLVSLLLLITGIYNDVSIFDWVYSYKYKVLCQNLVSCLSRSIGISDTKLVLLMTATIEGRDSKINKDLVRYNYSRLGTAKCRSFKPKLIFTYFVTNVKTSSPKKSRKK